ncbi:hypothetical protein CYFUS_006517 [Cystobacter fuscus]|uniref:HEAT repeat domain-containing protein n=1 Tax=Cystobacter fuscus TaxID=43 RepID=A0A250JAW4_9BACT|nr:HEAT repeat domain-containing protein [Cystobacter fuscus]ATB41055.1 hypothetical protein CYFUS_006517 [Cystobacter fuscus]
MIVNAGDWLRDILEEHVEELTALWPRRPRAWRTPGFSVRALRQLDERIDAHTDALALAGEDAIPLVDPLLGSEDPNEVLTATHAMLRMGDKAITQRVREAFEQAAADVLQSFAFALARARADTGPDEGPTIQHSVASLYARALRGSLASPDPLLRLLAHEDAAVRERAWHTLAMFGPKRRLDVRREVTATMKDEPFVRRAALKAAAWMRQPWLLDELRRLVDSTGTVRRDALELLAVLGKPEDMFRIRAAVSDIALGPTRFELVGWFGHPALVEVLFPAMEEEEPLTAAAAAMAFRRITGVSADSAQRVELEEDEVHLPDPTMARIRWHKLKDTFGGGTRWSWGENVERGLTDAALVAMDLPSLAEGRLRDAFHGRFDHGPAALEAFPYPG